MGLPMLNAPTDKIDQLCLILDIRLVGIATEIWNRDNLRQQKTLYISLG